MYSKETMDTIKDSIWIEGTGVWVNTGTDWDDKPGILLGDNGCWQRLSIEKAEELIKALQAKLQEIERTEDAGSNPAIASAI
jgi:hypothetical protein